MKNLDTVKTDAEIQADIKAAIENGDSEAFSNAQVAMAKQIEANILVEAKKAQAENLNDNAVMVQRGLNPLTTTEKAYYNEVISAGGFAGVETALPPTVFERVFEELQTHNAMQSNIN